MYIKMYIGGDIVRVYSWFVEKGGTGKSTSSLATLSYFNVFTHKKALLIDFDPQMTVTKLTGTANAPVSIVEVLTQDAKIKDAIVSVPDYGDVIPCKKSLATLASQLRGDALIILRNIIRNELEGLYDYVIIDCPPGVSGLPVTALVASDSVIIPVQASLSDIQSLPDNVLTLETAKRYNPDLMIEGVLLTMFEGRQNATKIYSDVAEQIASEQLKTHVFSQTIRRGVAVKEAQGMKQGLFKYAPGSNVAGDYITFIEDNLLKKGENNG